MTTTRKPKPYPTAEEDLRSSSRKPDSPQASSSSYRLAYADQDFLLRDELRAVRMQLELLKPEIMLQEHGIEQTVVIFGSTRIISPDEALKEVEKAKKELIQNPSNPELMRKITHFGKHLARSRYYDEARQFARLVADTCELCCKCRFFVMTGGGPGIMEAANRGASEANAKTVGLNIVLPFEQRPNPYITPELCFQFHYFAARKMHFLMRARAMVAFPGGFGTMDELFESLTLIQTKKIKPIPVLLFGKEFWEKAINFDFLLEEEVISPEDLHIFRFVETAQEAWDILTKELGLDVS